MAATKKKAPTKEKKEEIKAPIVEEKKVEKPAKQPKIEPKFKVGDIVYVEKSINADLEGTPIFPNYKNVTYTVEAYNADTDIYSIRNLKLLLHLKGENLLNPDEVAHDQLNRKQF